MIWADTHTPVIFKKMYFRRVDYLSFGPFWDYPTLYPRSKLITLKWGILPYCESPGPWPSTHSHSEKSPWYESSYIYIYIYYANTE